MTMGRAGLRYTAPTNLCRKYYIDGLGGEALDIALKNATDWKTYEHFGQS
jgi:hypothetical protein